MSAKLDYAGHPDQRCAFPSRTESDELEEIVQALFDVLDDLYVKAGARNFLLINAPPQDRSPGGENLHIPLLSFCESHSTLLDGAASELSSDISERFQTWNELLRSHAEDYASETTDASVFLFSSHSVASAFLDDPLDFGFDEDDATTEGGAIWLDELHFTSEVHAIIAQRLEEALRMM